MLFLFFFFSTAFFISLSLQSACCSCCSYSVLSVSGLVHPQSLILEGSRPAPAATTSRLAPLTSHLIFHTPTTATPTSTACHCLETPQPPSTFTNPARPSKPLTDSSFRNSFDAGVRHQQPSPLVSPFAFATAIDSLVSCEFSVSILSLFIFRPSFASTTFAASPLAHTQFKRCFSPLRQHLVFVSSSRRRGSFQSGVHPSQI